MKVLLLVLALALLVGGCGEDPADPRVTALREGGHTLVLRHATADGNSNQQEKLGDCARQRNLTEAGKEQAAAIASAVRRLDIPIDEVRASPMCRTIDTARLAFGRVTEDRDLLSPGVIGTEADDRRRAQALKRLVEEGPADGAGNVVLVTHTGNIGAGLEQETVQEGETLIYASGGELIGRVTAEQWASLRAP